ncbi:unnamed protein product [Darwinula stevensoni]|uniref:Uncharacterized protein n=1 Tax=Darwinula stevensoni TaxID=69355 RepID=A0A7R9FTU1_9CRUS|nr:unnamed protein product [Darwinula stevensoni]CAG0907109.1 unnamed protein product [Darwinula stevensoni]
MGKEPKTVTGEEHPSWVARRREKEKIRRSRFRGKIIKFDSEGIPVLCYNHRRNFPKVKSLSQQGPEGDERRVEAPKTKKGIHPSWAAKKELRKKKKEERKLQRMQETGIMPFQGTKKVFQD